MNTVAPPASMPAMAPERVMRFQKRENSTSGPNVAPKPAQANETIVNITLFLSRAITAATAVIISRIARDRRMTCLSVALFLNMP